MPVRDRGRTSARRLREGERARLQLKLDKSRPGGRHGAAGEGHARTWPTIRSWRELTCDPKFRRVLITDGRTAVGQAMAEAFSEAGASVVFVGVADPWKPFPGEDALRKIERVEIVPLDLTDTESRSTSCAEQNSAARVDILSTPPSMCAPAASSIARA